MNETNKEFSIKEVPTNGKYCDYHLYEGDRKIAEFNNKTEAEYFLKSRRDRKEVKNGRNQL